jgi:putative acetyltransferase
MLPSIIPPGYTLATGDASRRLRSKREQMMPWRFGEADLDCADVSTLVALHHGEMKRHSPPDACHVLPAEALRGSSITLFELRDEDCSLMGIGALKELGPDHGELKSMRTHPDALGRGVGGALLAGLVEEARRRGYARLSLETGSTANFAGALRLYEREGFVRSEPFGGYPASPFTRFYARTL